MCENPPAISCPWPLPHGRGPDCLLLRNALKVGLQTDLVVEFKGEELCHTVRVASRVVEGVLLNDAACGRCRGMDGWHRRVSGTGQRLAGPSRHSSLRALLSLERGPQAPTMASLISEPALPPNCAPRQAAVRARWLHDGGVLMCGEGVREREREMRER